MKRFGKIRKILLRALLVLLVLGCAGWLFENWRGAKAWEEAKARAEAAGVSLVRADYAGPEIPDEENLLLNPVFAEEFENEGEDRLREWARLPGVDGKTYRVQGPRPWSGTSVDYRNYFKDELSEDEARDRLAEWASDFEGRLDRLAKVILKFPARPVFLEGAATGPLFAETDWILAFRNLTHCYRDSGLVAIHSQEGEKAFQSVTVLFRLAEMTIGADVISVLVSNAFRSMTLDLIWEGLRLQVWTDGQLENFSKYLSEPRFEQNMMRALSYEAAFQVDVLEFQVDAPKELEQFDPFGYDQDGFARWYYYQGPQGWKDQRRAFVVSRSLDLKEILQDRDFKRLEEADRSFSVSDWCPMFAVVAGQSLIARAASSGVWKPETKVRICQVAIAAERVRQWKGSYPKTLAELTLDTPVQDSTDPEGRDLAYELGPRGRPQIWSRHQEELGEKGDEKLRWQFWAEESR